MYCLVTRHHNPVEALFSGNNIDNNGIDRQRLLKSNAQDLECCLLQFSSQSIEKSAAAAVSHGSNHNGGSIDLLPESAWNHSIQSKIIAKRRPEGGLVVQRWEKLKKSI